jgi:hypothetical protein
MKKPKNLLVMYKGGGYSGCYWEWNFFVFDNNGVFYNVVSTGSAGVKDEAEALAIAANDRDDVYRYKLNTKKGLAELATEINERWLLELCKFFSETLPDYGVYMLCSKCGCQISAVDATENIITDNYGENPMCPDCQFECECSYCNERTDDEYMVRSLADVDEKVENHDIPLKIKQDIIDSNAPICCYCFERIAEEKLTRLIAESKR